MAVILGRPLLHQNLHHGTRCRLQAMLLGNFHGMTGIDLGDLKAEIKYC